MHIKKNKKIIQNQHLVIENKNNLIENNNNIYRYLKCKFIPDILINESNKEIEIILYNNTAKK